MYEEFFKLSDSPFRLNPDPRFFYGSRSHNKAMAYLHYGLKQAEGFIVITGPVGAGKSMVIGHLLDQLNSSNVIAANLLTSNIEPNELLSQILSAFRIEAESKGRTGEIEAFEDYLFDQLNRGRRVLLIIDEAQNLPFKTLEELRMLSNLDYEGTPLFQVFLVGQPEFRATMEQPNMEQLRQRVIASYHLEPLSEEETRDYIHHRLAVAGWREDPAFSKNAFKAIHEETGGLPRRINTVCNRLMLYCSIEKTHSINAATVSNVCKELREEKLSSGKATADPMPVAVKVDQNPEREISAPEPIGEVAPAAVTSPPAQTSDDTAAPPPAREGEVKPNVVSIETARAKAQATPGDSDDAPIAKPTVTPKPAPKASPAMSSMSVLDRLRAKKEGLVEEERQEATLNDVASAIAAAQESPSPYVAQQSDDESVAAQSGSDALQWRKTLVQSIDETRTELKEANASIMRLTRNIAERQQLRMDRRRRVADSLNRAESLLNDLRAARS